MDVIGITTTHGAITIVGIMITIVGATITMDVVVSLTGKRGTLPSATSLIGGLFQTISGGIVMVD
jgi:hypothetical protein